MLSDAPTLRRLYHALQLWAESWNTRRPALIAAGLIDAREAPEIAPEGVEMNVNRVVGTDRAVWSGLHLHRDMHRFTDGLRALDETSGAARRHSRPGADGERLFPASQWGREAPERYRGSAGVHGARWGEAPW